MGAVSNCCTTSKLYGYVVFYRLLSYVGSNGVALFRSSSSSRPAAASGVVSLIVSVLAGLARKLRRAGAASKSSFGLAAAVPWAPRLSPATPPLQAEPGVSGKMSDAAAPSCMIICNRFCTRGFANCTAYTCYVLYLTSFLAGEWLVH